MKVKVCKKCGIEKPLLEFPKSKVCKDGTEGQCKACKVLDTLKWQSENVDKVRASQKRYDERHPEKAKERKKRHDEKYPEQVKRRKRKYTNKRIKEDPVFAYLMKIRKKTREYAFKKYSKVGNEFFKIVGIDIQGFRKYIESKFEEGMSWDNHGIDVWHIDHIIPISSATSIEEVERLSHYTNLQPLWKSDNESKGNNIL
jgi:Zn ribbon nucleic-acid-binding protein